MAIDVAKKQVPAHRINKKNKF